MIFFALFTLIVTIVQGVPPHTQNTQIVYPADENIKSVVRCPEINCPQWCPRFKGQNGCLYCGACNLRYQMCPPVKCPARPDVKCGIRIGRNGCKHCVCQQMTQRRQQVYDAARNGGQNAPPAPNCPTPQCSLNCQIVHGNNGCGHCRCYPPVCPPFSCPQNCNKYPGIDGCPQCDCGESPVCPSLPCDLSRCRHVVDSLSGCAVSCECNSIPMVSQPGYGK